jgi:hypothetical protein
MVLDDFVIDLRTNLFLSAENRLETSPVPIQIFLFIHIKSVNEKSMVQFLKDIARINDFRIGGDVSSPEEKGSLCGKVSLNSVAVCI